MLNEIKELEEYTSNSVFETEPFLCRLNHYCFLKQDLSGLERVLTILARDLLFSKFSYDQASSIKEQEEIIQQVKKGLQCWCGFENDDSFDFNLWLPKFYNKIYGSSGRKAWDIFEKKKIKFNYLLYRPFEEENLDVEESNLEETDLEETDFPEESLDGLDADISSSKTGSSDAKSMQALLKPKKVKIEYLPKSNDYKAINFERIIANAVYYGKLENYVLVCKKDFREHLYHRSDKKLKDTISQEEFLEVKYTPIRENPKKISKNAENWADEVLKFIGVYLIEKMIATRNCNFDISTININKSFLALWFAKKVNNGDYFKSFYWEPKKETQIKNSLEKLFPSSSHNSSVSKTYVSREFLEKYDFQIHKITTKEEAADFQKYFEKLNQKEEYLYFTDSGFGRPLTKNS